MGFFFTSLSTALVISRCVRNPEPGRKIPFSSRIVPRGLPVAEPP